jgi:hypothetical protein
MGSDDTSVSQADPYVTDLTPKPRGSNLGLEAHPVEYREWAYQLWAYLCGRRMKTVRERLMFPEEGDTWPARDIPIDTLYTWERTQKWKDRVREEVRRIAPDLHETIMSNLIMASHEASRWVLDMAHDRVPLRNPVEIAAAGVKLKAAMTVLDRTGYIPYQLTKDRSAPVSAPLPEDAPIAALDQGELMKRWYQPAVDRHPELIEEKNDGDDS